MFYTTCKDKKVFISMQLENDWLTTGLMDFEYKKYILLAYDRDYGKHCNDKKIFPYFNDVIEKLKITNEFLTNINFLENSKKEVDFVDLLNKRVVYHSVIKDESMDEIKMIAYYSKELLSDLFDRYRALFNEVSNNIAISGYRISHFNSFDGYAVLKYSKWKEKIIHYEIYRVMYPKPDICIKTSRVDLKTYYKDRLNKNVFDVIVEDSFPLKESMIPVFRHKLINKVMGFTE